MPLRQRQEVQKMLRFISLGWRRRSGVPCSHSCKHAPRWSTLLALALACIATGPTNAAILPDRLAGAMKSEAKTVQPADPALFEEYGFEGGEQAVFGPTTLIAWRFHDSTGAMAAFQAVRPQDARSVESKLNKLAALTRQGALYDYGNYLVQVTGKVPSEEDLAQVYLALPKVEQSPLPIISSYLPAQGLISNSERYILGPVSLQKFDPGIPPSVAAFHMSAEAQYARYRTKSGEMGMAIFSYPTPGIARERAEDLAKIPGLIPKRTGPLVAVISGNADPDTAERLLGKVNYQASVTLNERAPNHEVKSFARTILNYMAFAGLIIVFCVLSGVIFAGVRILSRRIGPKGDDGGMITLHLEGK